MWLVHTPSVLFPIGSLICDIDKVGRRPYLKPDQEDRKKQKRKRPTILSRCGYAFKCWRNNAAMCFLCEESTLTYSCEAGKGRKAAR